jgi:hypothetical protein
VNGLMDVASTWMVSEKRREEREREVGRAWLAVLAEGDTDKVGTMITDLADRSASLDYEVLTKLERSARAYMQWVAQAAFNQVVRRRSNIGCSCGCDGGEEEGATVCTAPY